MDVIDDFSIRTEVLGDAAYPGAKLILTLSITPEPVHISEQMVSDMQSEYKSHFPKMAARNQAGLSIDTSSERLHQNLHQNPCNETSSPD